VAPGWFDAIVFPVSLPPALVAFATAAPLFATGRASASAITPRFVSHA
jgi:hypothetical protein